MKKSFRNRLLASAAAASMSFLLLSGFDSSLTAEDVQKNMQEALASMGGLNANVQGTADVTIDISAGGETQSLPISGSMNYTVTLIEEPFQMALSGSASGDASAMGMAGGIEMEMYVMGQEDGTGIAYVRIPEGEDTGWHAAQIPAEDLAQLTQTLKASLSGDASAAGEQMGIDLSSLQEQMIAGMTLEADAVNVNGVDCYELSQTIDGDTLYSVVSEVVGAVPNAGIDESALSAFQMLFSGLRVDAVTDCSVDSFTPVYGSVDMSGSDFSTIGQMLGSMMLSGDGSQEMPQIGVTANALNYSVSFSDVPADIEIPAEALAAEVETTLSLSDMSGAMAETE